MNTQTQNLTAIVIRFDVVRNIPKNSEMALLAEKYEQLNFSLHGQKQGETQVMLDSRCQPEFDTLLASGSYICIGLSTAIDADHLEKQCLSCYSYHRFR